MPKAKTTTKKVGNKPSKRTVVTLLLDRSGSMGVIKNQTIEGYNTYISGLKSGKKVAIDFNFVQFDSVGIETTIQNMPIKKVPMLTHEDYTPRGGTPLIDAAYETIQAVAAAARKAGDNPNIVVCIQTDGEENASSGHTWKELSSLVEEKKGEGWAFNFIGAGIDAYKQAEMIGISNQNTMSYGMDRGSTMNAFASTSSNSLRFAQTSNLAAMNYTMDQKLAAGDIYDKDLAASLNSAKENKRGN